MRWVDAPVQGHGFDPCSQNKAGGLHPLMLPVITLITSITRDLLLLSIAPHILPQHFSIVSMFSGKVVPLKQQQQQQQQQQLSMSLTPALAHPFEQTQQHHTLPAPLSPQQQRHQQPASLIKLPSSEAGETAVLLARSLMTGSTVSQLTLPAPLSQSQLVRSATEGVSFTACQPFAHVSSC